MMAFVSKAKAATDCYKLVTDDFKPSCYNDMIMQRNGNLAKPRRNNRSYNQSRIQFYQTLKLQTK